MKLLVSVRDLAEARVAARAGVHFIDLKEPSLGALGGLPPAQVADLVRQLRQDAPAAKVSATIGDWPADALDAILAQARAVAACGVDYVKVGVAAGPRAAALLAGLGQLQADGLPLVPVFLAEEGLPPALLDQALALAFPALMLDTQHKQAGSLLDLWGVSALARFVAQVRASGALAGLAGALRLHHLAELQRLAPDFAGFRSAVCVADRAGALDPERLSLLLRVAAESSAAPLPV